MPPIAIQMAGGATAFVDENDRHLLQYQWFMTSSGHPARALGGGAKEYLARAVLLLPKDSPIRIGHVDFDPLNACRSNLCLLLQPRRTHRMIAPVRSRTFTDQYFVTVGGKWLGDFDTRIEALAVYEAEVARQGIRRRNFY